MFQIASGQTQLILRQGDSTSGDGQQNNGAENCLFHAFPLNMILQTVRGGGPKEFAADVPATVQNRSGWQTAAVS